MTKETSLVPNCSLSFHVCFPVFPRRQLNTPVCTVWPGVCFPLSEEVPWQAGFALQNTQSQPIIVPLHIRQAQDPEKFRMCLRHPWPYPWAPSKWWMSLGWVGAARWHCSTAAPPAPPTAARGTEGQAGTSPTLSRNANTGQVLMNRASPEPHREHRGSAGETPQHPKICNINVQTSWVKIPLLILVFLTQENAQTLKFLPTPQRTGYADTWVRTAMRNTDFLKNTIPHSSQTWQLLFSTWWTFPIPTAAGDIPAQDEHTEHSSPVPQLSSWRGAVHVQEGQCSHSLMGNAQVFLEKWLFPLLLNPQTIFNYLIL